MSQVEAVMEIPSISHLPMDEVACAMANVADSIHLNCRLLSALIIVLWTVSTSQRKERKRSY